MATVAYTKNNNSTSERGKRHYFTVTYADKTTDKFCIHQVEAQTPLTTEERRIATLLAIRGNLQALNLLDNPDLWPTTLNGMIVQEPK